MAASPQTNAKDTPRYPGSGQPQVVQPGQLAPAGPGRAMARAPRQAAPEGAPVRHLSVPATISHPDPILFREEAFRDQADYERTSKRIAARIRRGEIVVREPDEH